MKFRIIKIEVSGMKGIEKPMTVCFLNDTIEYKKPFEESSIKAIYGMNGSGKSSFMNAIDVYKKICTSYSYLVEDSTVKVLNDLINLKAKVFRIKVFFMVKDMKMTLSHEIVVNNKTGRPFIESETLSRITGKTINGEIRTVLKCEGPDLVFFSEEGDSNSLSDYLRKALEKKNEYSSMLAVYSDVNFTSGVATIIQEERLTLNLLSTDETFLVVMLANMFAMLVRVFLDEKDRHVESISREYTRLINAIGPEMSPSPIVSGKALIPKTLFEAYKRQVEKLAGFLKLFKPELKRIDIDKKIIKNVYQCRLVMNYGSYSIDYEYESSGLRNLMEMFSCLEQASRGGIAFIDEMDANMNEVYLKKLCEFFVNYGEGQLCFTTHNSVPMNILKKQKYGIDFINNEKQSVQWIRNGNYSPSKLYSEGMIPGLPFNIEDFDFLSVFFSEEK